MYNIDAADRSIIIREKDTCRMIGKIVSDLNADIIALILTAGLSVFWFTIKYGAKKNISPVILICLAGVAGVFGYGWS